MNVVTSVEEISSIITSLKSKNKQFGLVPTMGALHEGHLSLVKESKLNNDVTWVSIFVNPTQFDNKNDLENYPITIEQDLKLLKTIECDFVFIPNANDIYNNKINSESFSFDGLENEMEGKHRTNHFDGVGTIVKKLFEIIQPNNAYFGEKDFQQLQIIKKLTEKLQLPINIVGCDIFRESDGLAMSSRNLRLSNSQRKAAPFIYKTLLAAKVKTNNYTFPEISNWIETEFKNNSELDLEYFEIAEEETLKTVTTRIPNKKHRAFIAVFAGEIRLIDNISL